jgi:glutathione S-transferase
MTHGSPFARKVRIVLEEKGLAYEPVIASPGDPNSGVGNHNPLVKVPVLVRDDGSPVYDSPVIVEYAEGLSSKVRLIPEAFEDRIEVKRWEALADGVMEAVVAISHDLRLPEAERHPAAWHARQQKKVDGGLARMEADLKGRDYCFGNGLTLADIACGVALWYMDRVLPQQDWRATHPRLKDHDAFLSRRPSFQATLPK